jgi:predicted CopG family antitoxin
MARKNIKVSDIVHEELEARSQKHESFDDVLQRLLELRPTGVDELVAYYPDQLRLPAIGIIERLKEMTDLDPCIVDQDGHYEIQFDAANERTILTAVFRDEPTVGVVIKYRNARGEMEELTRIFVDDDPNTPDTALVELPESDVIESSGVIEDRFEEEAEPLINGAIARWGDDS